ncbi:hypothetical protein GN958_ATG04820, partial [Phytophthora infestans]
VAQTLDSRDTIADSSEAGWRLTCASAGQAELVALSMSLLRPANARCVGRCTGRDDAHLEVFPIECRRKEEVPRLVKGGQNPAFVMSGAVDPISRRTGKPGHDGRARGDMHVVSAVKCWRCKRPRRANMLDRHRSASGSSSWRQTLSTELLLHLVLPAAGMKDAAIASSYKT